MPVQSLESAIADASAMAESDARARDPAQCFSNTLFSKNTHSRERLQLGSGIPPWAVARARAEIDFGRADAGLVTPRIPNTWTDSRANGWRRLWGFGGWRLRLDLQR